MGFDTIEINLFFSTFSVSIRRVFAIKITFIEQLLNSAATNKKKMFYSKDGAMSILKWIDR